MSEMCFDDFDYDRHSDNCECSECIEDKGDEDDTDYES